MSGRAITLKENEAIRAACKGEPLEAVAARFGRSLTVVRRIAALGRKSQGWRK